MYVRGRLGDVATPAAVGVSAGTTGRVVGLVRLLLVREFSVCICVCVCACVFARSLARSPSWFHEACSEDMTDTDETEEVINLCCIVHWLTKGKSTECRDTPVRYFVVPGSRFAVKLDVLSTVCV